MPTPIFICGAECGINAVGTAGVGVEHWSSTGAAAPALDTSIYNSTGGGIRSLRYNSANSCYLAHTFASAVGSPATVVGRFYVYFTTLLGGSSPIFRDVSVDSGVYFNVSDNTLRARASGTTASSGFVVETGIWYRVDFKYVLNTTRTCDIQVNGSNQTQASVAGAAASSTGVLVGNTLAPGSGDFYLDDIIVSGTSGDYPIGAGGVVGLYPNGDDSAGHVYNAAGDFGKGSTGTTDLATPSSSETTSYQSLATPLSTSVGANYIRDRLGGANEFLSWNFSDTPTSVTSVNGLMVVTCNHAAGTAGCTISGRINDAGTADDIYTLADFSENTIVTAVKTYPTAPSTGTAWTKTLVDGLKFQWGAFTATAPDVNPDPILDGVMFEVDYISGITTVTPSIISLTTTVYTTGVTVTISPSLISPPTANVYAPLISVQVFPQVATSTFIADTTLTKINVYPQQASVIGNAELVSILLEQGKLETIVDTFNSTLGNWDNDSASNVSVVSGRAKFDPTLGSSYAEVSGYDSAQSQRIWVWDLKDSYIFAEIEAELDPQQAQNYYFDVWDPSTYNSYGFVIQYNEGWRLANLYSGTDYVTYSPTNHRWLRVRESGGTVYHDVSSDGSSWNNLWSLASTSDVELARLIPYVSLNQDSNSWLYLDNVNNLPLIPSTVLGITTIYDSSISIVVNPSIVDTTTEVFGPTALISPIAESATASALSLDATVNIEEGGATNADAITASLSAISENTSSKIDIVSQEQTIIATSLDATISTSVILQPSVIDGTATVLDSTILITVEPSTILASTQVFDQSISVITAAQNVSLTASALNATVTTGGEGDVNVDAEYISLVGAAENIGSIGVSVRAGVPNKYGTQ